MNITITRIDTLGGIPDPNQHGTLLSADETDSWDGVISVLHRHGIDQFQTQQLADFHAEAPTETITFQHHEFINAGVAAYTCNVNYVIAVRA